MLFHSVQFLGFFVVVFALYWAGRNVRWLRLGALLVGSLLFYAAWHPLPILLFAWYAAVNSGAAAVMRRVRSEAARRAVLAVAVVSHLGILCTFKYADMLLETIEQLGGPLGVTYRHESLGLLLPIGLSFIAFQAISYIVDYYRGDVTGGTSFFRQLLYLFFFPQVVAGPIVRSRDLLERFDEVPTLTTEQGANGLFRIAVGMVKKLLLADVLAVGLIDRVFSQPEAYTSTEAAVAVVAYTFQIYLDFSAYSDIAIGAAALFGFHLPENFNRPYQAKNLFEFWNRWHISLSTWLRDYLYIPLGGNRCSRYKVLRNLAVVMVLGGLWHGADWRFAFWGGLHGALLVGNRIYWWAKGGRPRSYTAFAVARGILLTFTAVALTRIFFRAPDMEHAWRMFAQLAEGTVGFANVSALVWTALGIAIVAHALPKGVSLRVAELFGRLPVPLRAAALVGLGLLVRQVADFEAQPYIYFQF